MAGLVCPDPGKYESVSKNTVSGEIRYAWRYTFQIISSLLDRMGSEANPEAVSSSSLCSVPVNESSLKDL